jgi:hypothetical protein
MKQNQHDEHKKYVCQGVCDLFDGGASISNSSPLKTGNCRKGFEFDTSSSKRQKKTSISTNQNIFERKERMEIKVREERRKRREEEEKKRERTENQKG